MAFSVVTTVLSGAKSFDLVTLAMVKVDLDITSNDTSSDAWLRQAISQVSSTMARYCKRTFAPELVQDTFDIQQDAYPYQTPGGFAEIPLSRWPVLALASVTQTGGSSGQTLADGKDFRLDAKSGSLIRLNPFSGAATTWEAQPVTVTYVAGFGNMANERHSIPAVGPFTFDVDSAALFSCDVAVAYSDGAPMVRVNGAPARGQYSVNAGKYTFNSADAGKAVDCSFATFVVPADLAAIALRLLTARYRGKGRDPSLVEQETPGVGRQRWWFGSAPGQSGPFPPDVAADLEDYRMPTVA